MPSIGGLTSSQSFGGSSQASSIDVPSAPPSTPTTIDGSNLDIPASPTPGLCDPYVSICLLTLITAPNVFPELPIVNANDTDPTDLVLSPDSNRVMLTMQRPLVRVVIQDSFDILRAELQFTDAFPNATLAAQFVRNALLRSALNHMPGAGRIYQRLLHDEDYVWRIIPLVSRKNICDHS